MALSLKPFAAVAICGLAGVCGSLAPAQARTVTISSPASKAVIPLSKNIARQTAAIPFTATSSAAGTINWTGKLRYTTSGGIGPFTRTITFTSPSGSASNHAIASAGGEFTITAEQAGTAASRKAYVVGNPGGVPDAEITKYLTALYKADHAGLASYTPDLLAHIALQESGYRQFDRAKTLYGVTARWPIENFPTASVPSGKYIGLMQAELTTMAIAFDWKVNAKEGLEILKGKINSVLAYQAQQRSAISGLRAMTGVQIENSSLLLYGGFSSRTPPPGCVLNGGPMRYYIPKGTSWIVNPAIDCRSTQGNTSREYVAGVRNSTLPQ